LTQKALAEGGRLLNYFCAQQVDISHSSDNAEQRQEAETLLALLTPIAKGFLSELSLEATSNGVQVLGGHGFISEWGQEQHYRDTRITAIYEGTNSIQGLDLLGRKILASNGKVMAPFVDLVKSFCRDNSEHALAQTLQQALEQWLALTDKIGEKAASNPDEVNAAAYDYLMYSGYVVLAYFWARSSVSAEQALQSNSDEAGFYQAKLATAQFYFERLLPRTDSLEKTILSGANNLMALEEAAFNF